jgi:hypothetical protein
MFSFYLLIIIIITIYLFLFLDQLPNTSRVDERVENNSSVRPQHLDSNTINKKFKCSLIRCDFETQNNELLKEHQLKHFKNNELIALRTKLNSGQNKRSVGEESQNYSNNNNKVLVLEKPQNITNANKLIVNSVLNLKHNKQILRGVSFAPKVIEKPKNNSQTLLSESSKPGFQRVLIKDFFGKTQKKSKLGIN